MQKEKTAYLRKTVAEMICRAEKELPEGTTFIIGDAWRPQYIQKEVLNWFIKHFLKSTQIGLKRKLLMRLKNMLLYLKENMLPDI